MIALKSSESKAGLDAANRSHASTAAEVAFQSKIACRAAASANGANGTSGMAGDAARVAVERSGRLPRYNAETSDVKHQRDGAFSFCRTR